MINLLIHAQKNKARIENVRLRDDMDPFLIPTDRFIERYRLPPHLAQKFINELSPYMEDDSDQRIPLHLRVLATLNFFACGSKQRRVGMDAFGSMSQTTISKCISEVSKGITNHLGQKYIVFPRSTDEVEMIKERFLKDHGWNGVLGLVDGTLIRVSGIALKMKRLYIKAGRRFASINTQVIIDSDMRILSINARYPGAVHDTHVWKNSKIFTLLEEKFNLADQNNNIYRNSFLLGDLGYPLQPWLMIPIKDVADDKIPEKRYNKKQRQIRNKIERFNACFKNRWGCLLGENALRYSHEKAGYIIYACAVLHNFLIENSFDIEFGIPPVRECELQGDEENENEYHTPDEDEYRLRGEAIRTQLIADYF